MPHWCETFHIFPCVRFRVALLEKMGIFLIMIILTFPVAYILGYSLFYYLYFFFHVFRSLEMLTYLRTLVILVIT